MSPKKTAENGRSANVGYEAEIWKLEDALKGSTCAPYYAAVCPILSLLTDFDSRIARRARFEDLSIQTMPDTASRKRVPAESLSRFHSLPLSIQFAESFGGQVWSPFARARATSSENRSLIFERKVLFRNTIRPTRTKLIDH